MSHFHVDVPIIPASCILNRSIAFTDLCAGLEASPRGLPGLARSVVVADEDEGGKVGICISAAALANAIQNATGIRMRDYPITLDKLLQRLPEFRWRHDARR